MERITEINEKIASVKAEIRELSTKLSNARPDVHFNIRVAKDMKLIELGELSLELERAINSYYKVEMSRIENDKAEAAKAAEALAKTLNERAERFKS